MLMPEVCAFRLQAPENGVKSGAMTTPTDKLRTEVLNYFATVNASGERTLSVRDFNSQLMSNTFDPVERGALGTVLEALVADGILVQRAPLQYSLTPKGSAAAREAKQEIERGIKRER
jgi:hypothetical protein